MFRKYFRVDSIFQNVSVLVLTPTLLGGKMLKSRILLQCIFDENKCLKKKLITKQEFFLKRGEGRN